MISSLPEYELNLHFVTYILYFPKGLSPEATLKYEGQVKGSEVGHKYDGPEILWWMFNGSLQL